MSKGLGRIIGIKFTHSLINTSDEINQNKEAFAVRGKELKHINGKELEKVYGIGEVRYRPPIASDDINFMEGEVINLEIRGDRLILEAVKDDEK